MIEMITRFVSWIKDCISLVISLPSRFLSLISGFADFLSFLPGSLGTIIVGFVVMCITFVIIYAVVKLVASLL